MVRKILNKQTNTDNQMKEMTLKDAVEFTFRHRHEWIHGKAVETHRINCGHFLRIIGPETPVEMVRPLSFNLLKEELLNEEWCKGKKRTPGGVNRILAALSTVLNECYKNELVTRKPAYTRCKENKNARARYYSEEEMKALYAAALSLPENGQLLHDSIRFSYYTGDRLGELLKLQWSEVNFEDREITFLNTKSGSNHRIHMPSALVEMLKDRFHHRVCDRVFPWEGSRLGADLMRRHFRKAQTIAGISHDRCIHSIRHTTGTHLISKGVNVRTVMGVLNHSNINTTLRYAANQDKTVADAIELL